MILEGNRKCANGRLPYASSRYEWPSWQEESYLLRYCL